MYMYTIICIYIYMHMICNIYIKYIFNHMSFRHRLLFYPIILKFNRSRQMEEKVMEDLIHWGLVNKDTGKAMPLGKITIAHLRGAYDQIQHKYPTLAIQLRPKNGEGNTAEYIKHVLATVVGNVMGKTTTVVQQNNAPKNVAGDDM